MAMNKIYSFFTAFFGKPEIISTLVYRIIVQDGINVEDGKIPNNNKRAGWNKAVQVGLFHYSLV